jgi:hypothetical protein
MQMGGSGMIMPSARTGVGIKLRATTNNASNKNLDFMVASDKSGVSGVTNVLYFLEHVSA